MIGWLIDLLQYRVCDCRCGKTRTVLTGIHLKCVTFLQMYNSWHTPAFQWLPPSTLSFCFVFCHVLFPRCNYSLQGPSIPCDIAPLWWSGLVWALTAGFHLCRCKAAECFPEWDTPSFFSPTHLPWDEDQKTTAGQKDLVHRQIR